jgi:hypothetical protein
VTKWKVDGSGRGGDKEEGNKGGKNRQKEMRKGESRK